jgi:hypothetical protein
MKLEGTERPGTARMNYSLWNALMVKLHNLFPVNDYKFCIIILFTFSREKLSSINKGPFLSPTEAESEIS